MPVHPSCSDRSAHRPILGRGTASLLATLLLLHATIGLGWSQQPTPPSSPGPPGNPEASPSDNPTSPATSNPGTPDDSETDPAASDPDVLYRESSLAFPTPSELFRSLSKGGPSSWKKLYRPPVVDTGTDRHRGAIALGTVFADLHLAAEASDVQRVRNLGQDALVLGRGLGVAEHLTPLLHELGELAEQNSWDPMRNRLQHCLGELDERLQSQRDHDLAILIDLGMWLRVLEISSQRIVTDEDFDRLRLCIGELEILENLQDRHAKLSNAARESKEIDEIGIELSRLIWRWDGRSGTPPDHEDVEASYIKIRNLLRRLLDRA